MPMNLTLHGRALDLEDITNTRAERIKRYLDTLQDGVTLESPDVLDATGVKAGGMSEVIRYLSTHCAVFGRGKPVIWGNTRTVAEIKRRIAAKESK